MLKKTISYVDFDGNERTEDFYFNLSKAELLEMSLSTSGGIENYIKRIIDTQDSAKLMALFKKIIDMSYGEKSLDGKKFVKNKELLNDFKSTEAYSQLYVELATDNGAATTFINGIVPAEIATQVEKTNISVVQ